MDTTNNKITPLQYFESIKEEISLELDDQNFDTIDVNNIINKISHHLLEIDSIKDSNFKTRKYIEKNFQEMDHRDYNVITYYLALCLGTNESYINPYKLLAVKENRRAGTVIFKILVNEPTTLPSKENMVNHLEANNHGQNKDDGIISPNKAHSNEYDIRTRIFIVEAFDRMLDGGWRYAFVHEKDYDVFVNILILFFMQQDYTLPENVIKLTRTCKTRLGNVLGYLHKELAERTLKSDTKYFEIIRCLNVFENEQNLYKILARETS